MITIITIIYIISVITAYNYLKIAFGKEGIWKNLDTNFVDVMIVFTPLFNSLFIFAWIIKNPYENKNKINYNEFFKNENIY